MGYVIGCETCGQESWARNIVDLLDNHTDAEGWFLCESGHRAFIEKIYRMQEAGDPWSPYLRGAVRLGAAGKVYQPFVFLVSYEPAGQVSDVWFCYYKDLRESGGRLKLGHGPGGPPVLAAEDVLSLVKQLLDRGCVSPEDVRALICE